uniref:Uncharacterized protein n=1 Tax=Lactuca sativa TaxID=4236 RepID=A0A9R1XW84_LACSA|nr:hypothetical protein LSAT_V11C100004070 [Lactuca sativa]
MKISEKTSATRSTIIVPFNGISWFFDIFNYYVTFDDQDIASKELQLDSKAIYYITHYTMLKNVEACRFFYLCLYNHVGITCVYLYYNMNIPKENAIMFVQIANLH